MRCSHTLLGGILLLAGGASCADNPLTGSDGSSSAGDLAGFWEATDVTLAEFTCRPEDSPLVDVAGGFAGSPPAGGVRLFYEFSDGAGGERLAAVLVCDSGAGVCVSTPQESDAGSGLTVTQESSAGALTVSIEMQAGPQQPDDLPIDVTYTQDMVITRDGNDRGTVRLSSQTRVAASGDVPAGSLGAGSPEIAAGHSVICLQDGVSEMTRGSDPAGQGFSVLGPSGTAAPAPALREEDHILAVGDPPVTVVEYLDFECPACGVFAREVMPSIRRDYIDSGRVRWVVRHFPLESIHAHAALAAQAAECAADQNAFWEYHDLLFQNQGALAAADLEAHAGSLGLDPGVFSGCLDGGGKRSRVQADLESGLELGVAGTPTFFVNDRLLQGAPSLEELAAVLDEALAGSGS